MHESFWKVLILFITSVTAKIETQTKEVGDDESTYVVSIQEKMRMEEGVTFFGYCTGTLIAAQWVLTAAHCLGGHPTHVAVRGSGNATTLRNNTGTRRRILKLISHPKYKRIERQDYAYSFNDIALILIEKILTTYGKLSAVDYQALIGYRVKHAGYKYSNYPAKRDAEVEDGFWETLKWGEGVLARCNQLLWRPNICLAYKCEKIKSRKLTADPGGPVLHRGKVVAVITGAWVMKENINTPVSPYAGWLNEVIKHRTNDRHR